MYCKIKENITFLGYFWLFMKLIFWVESLKIEYQTNPIYFLNVLGMILVFYIFLNKKSDFKRI